MAILSVTDKAARVKGDRDYAGFTYGYNLSPFAQQVQEIAKATDNKSSVILVAEPGTEAYVAAAALVSRSSITGIVLRSVSTSFAAIKDYDDVHFHPGAVKFGDLPGLILTNANSAMLLPKFVDKTFQARMESILSMLPISHTRWVTEVTDEELNKWLQEITTKK